MADRLNGKIALVFGGGASGPGWGNGKAAAVLMAREGARVMVADIEQAAAAATCAIINQEGGRASPVVCDVMRPADISTAVQACVTQFGGVDILLNNVGVGGKGQGLFAHEEEAWDQVFATNVRSVFTAIRHVIPIMLARGGGRIVNVSSTAALRIMGGSISHAYASSKAAVIQLTRTIALEFAAKGIRCNCVVPGMIDTPFASGGLRSAFSAEEADQLIARRHAVSPTGAQGTAWDVAQAVLYLASAESNYVNGHALTVDGGYVWTTPHW